MHLMQVMWLWFGIWVATLLQGNIYILFTDLSFTLFFSVLHVAAHLVNALNFSENYNEDFLSLNAANYRGEVSQLSFYILLFKYLI